MWRNVRKSQIAKTEDGEDLPLASLRARCPLREGSLNLMLFRKARINMSHESFQLYNTSGGAGGIERVESETYPFVDVTPIVEAILRVLQ